jgi:uncharacterized protein involved in exopolysaccharide biosynthesis
MSDLDVNRSSTMLAKRELQVKESWRPELSTPDTFQFNELWRVLLRRKWVLLTCVLTSVATCLVGSYLATPFYRASVMLRIDPEYVKVLPYEDSSRPSATFMAEESYLITQKETLQSRVTQSHDRKRDRIS